MIKLRDFEPNLARGHFRLFRSSRVKLGCNYSRGQKLSHKYNLTFKKLNIYYFLRNLVQQNILNIKRIYKYI